jgi:hypothetical protein
MQTSVSKIAPEDRFLFVKNGSGHSKAQIEQRLGSMVRVKHLDITLNDGTPYRWLPLNSALIVSACTN